MRGGKNVLCRKNLRSSGDYNPARWDYIENVAERQRRRLREVGWDFQTQKKRPALEEIRTQQPDNRLRRER